MCKTTKKQTKNTPGSLSYYLKCGHQVWPVPEPGFRTAHQAARAIRPASFSPALRAVFFVRASGDTAPRVSPLWEQAHFCTSEWVSTASGSSLHNHGGWDLKIAPCSCTEHARPASRSCKARRRFHTPVHKYTFKALPDTSPHSISMPTKCGQFSMSPIPFELPALHTIVAYLCKRPRNRNTLHHTYLRLTSEAFHSPTPRSLSENLPL